MISHLFLVKAKQLLSENMRTSWSLRQTRELANVLVDQGLTEPQRERDLLALLHRNRYYDHRNRVAAKCHAKRRKQDLRDAGLDLSQLKRC